MLTAEFLKTTFEAALPYDQYVTTGTSDQHDAWAIIHGQAILSPDQTSLISGFERTMRVLVSSGIWCGDCVRQGPLLDHIAHASPATTETNGENSRRVDLRFVDRDDHPDFAQHLQICGGMRVPVAVFMAEDFEPVSIFGDRTLSRYRAMAASQLGASCPVSGAPVSDVELADVTGDWLDEFERVHLLLRLSARLRQKHGD